MQSNDQMSLGLDLQPLPAAQAPFVRQRAPKQADRPAFSVQDMALALEQHPDYRVLRRLVPRDDWGPWPVDHDTQRVLVLDTETTGLDARQERIIELALLSVLVDRVTGQPVGPVAVYEGFEDPGKPIAPAITEITGITDDMVRGHRLDDARIHALVEAADLIVAHNAAFDRPFVEARLPVFAQRAWNCSLVGIDWKAEGHGSAKLEFLAHERGWFYDAHRALVDCHALLQVLACPLRDGQTGLNRLMAGAAQTRYKLRATGAPFESKDLLKARSYRWDSEARVWWTSVAGEAALQEECAWLKAQVYANRSARVHLEVQDSRVQFSARSGPVRECAL